MSDVTETAAIRVLLADDHEMVRSGIKALLGTMANVRVVGDVRNGEELLAALASQEHPDVVITDLAMPGLDGLAAIGRIRARYPMLRVLVLSMYDSADFVRQAVANGANGYIMKGAPPEELARALQAVMETGSYFGSAVAQRLLEPQASRPQDELTPRQIEILVLLAQGLSSKEIGYQLGLSSKTIDVHRTRIMQRLEIGDVASLTRYAVRKGLVKA